MLFLRLSFASDLLSESKIPDEYAGLLWSGPSDKMPGDKCLTCLGASRDGHALKVRVAIGNPIPLFYGWDHRGCLVLSDSCAAVWEAIHSSDAIQVDHLDRTGLIEAFLFDGPLADRTLLADVKKFQMGELAFVDIESQRVESQWDWLPSLQASDEISEKDVLETAKKHILRLSKAFGERASAVLPLTGGLDSRLLAGLARHEGEMDLASYTFQRGPSLETWCAKKVAKNLDINHITVNLPAKACYQDFARLVVRKTAGMVSGMHCHGLYSCEYSIPRGWCSFPRVFGYFGDPVTGAMTDNKATREHLDDPESILKKYGDSIFPELVQRHRTEILADLAGSFESFKKSRSQLGTFHEFWKIQQRQSNLITHLFSYHRSEQGAEVLLPFLDQEFIEFFLGLPYDQRKDRALFKRAFKEIYPDLFGLPTIHFKHGSFLSVVETIFEKMESGFNRLSPGQECLLSPFKYEQHEKNLFNFLRSDVQKGIDIVCEIESIKERFVQFPVWKHSTPKEYYRLAALHYLLDTADNDGSNFKR